MVFLGPDEEWLVQYANRKLQTAAIDFFIFGHRHLPLEIALQKNATYLNTGDWIEHETFGVFEEGVLRLKSNKANS